MTTNDIVTNERRRLELNVKHAKEMRGLYIGIALALALVFAGIAASVLLRPVDRVGSAPADEEHFYSRQDRIQLKELLSRT